MHTTAMQARIANPVMAAPDALPALLARVNAATRQIAGEWAG